MFDDDLKLANIGTLDRFLYSMVPTTAVPKHLIIVEVFILSTLLWSMEVLSPFYSELHWG